MNVDIKIEGNSSQETHIVTQNQESILRVAAVVNSAIKSLCKKEHTIIIICISIAPSI